ncbi:MAG: 4Fe-4S dicluster domain-containing protein [Candidatus Electrothrix aestuarii]|uniref:4Fe-4S dicluster domain-containing protein n=1 Tax=Candidatus Electrothrix aestuarii TaxID=3062594 RepID=A0AAU8LUF2_9BACT|nr:4Fe-4S binding protein [Candidatus Electrothrix aestuarii]
MTAKTRVFFLLSLLLITVIGTSHISTKIWGGKPEKLPNDIELVLSPEMSLKEFGQKNDLPNPVLKKVFQLQQKQDLQKKLSETGIALADIERKIKRAAALEEEHQSKNWIKIPVKFGLWFIFLGLCFHLIRKGKITPGARKILYLTAVVLFGVILGADPGAMGTIKDAIALYGAKGVIFPPRMIAMTVFLLLVLLANKFICGWGCQLGTLQDLIFRLNREKKERKSIFPQFRLPFVLTNAVRIVFFIAFTLIAFAWATDIIDPIDPFKIFKPAMIKPLGWGFILGILILSLFVYRPWCQLFCPFGLVGWLVEKASIFKVKVNYDTCIGCEACTKACPSTAMEAILKQEKTIPDCFSCASCIDVCPTGSVQFQAGKREKPPEGKFTGKKVSRS